MKKESRELAARWLSSDKFAAHMCVACIGDKVTDTVIKQDSGAVRKDLHVGFIYEIAERIFVLSDHLCKANPFSGNELEVIGDCHSANFKKNTTKESSESAAFCVLFSTRKCIYLSLTKRHIGHTFLTNKNRFIPS